MEKGKRPIITLGGNMGSGKSSTARGLAERLGYERFSGGDFMRMLATERGMQLNDFHKLAEEDDSIDLLIDEKQRDFMQSHENFVIDSRLGFHWAPEAFNVFLTLDERIAAERILNDMKENPNRQVEEINDLDDVIEKTRHRVESNRKRYMSLYNVDHTAPENFDLIVDTGQHDLHEVTEIIYNAYQKWLKT